MEEFPPNSKKWKADQRAAEDRDVRRVTSASAVRRRKPLGKQFHSVFFGGDARSAFEYTIENVLIPAAQEVFLDAWHSTMEKIIYGDRRTRRPRTGGPISGPGGYVSYGSYSRMPAPGPMVNDRPPLPKMLSRRARSRHNFDEIVINSRQEAEEVLDRLYDLISKYESANVADLYALTGLESSHTDHKWGWTDLRGARVGRVRGGGYLLELPEPEQFE